MSNPADNLAGISWPQRRTCPACKKVFFAFTSFAKFCTPACRYQSTGKVD